MRRPCLARCWVCLTVTVMGATPMLGVGCLQTHDERDALLDAALASPWDGGFVAAAITAAVNPDDDEDGDPDNALLQGVLDGMYEAIATVIRSQIAVRNPYGWSDLGRPR